MKGPARLPLRLFVIAASTALAACGSGVVSTTGVDAGTDAAGDVGAAPEAGRAKPRAFVTSTMAPGASAATQCRLTAGTWLDVGSGGQSVDDGDSFRNCIVHVECAVKPEAGVFRVTGRARLDCLGSAMGDVNTGAIALEGLISGRDVDRGVSATFTRATLGTFTQPSCTLEYPGASMGAAPGRVWGVLKCASATEASQDQVCQAQAEIKLENCAQ